MAISDFTFFRRTMIVVGVMLACALACWLRHILLLLFAAVVISIAIGSVIGPIERRFNWPHWLSLGTVTLVVATMALLTFAFFGLSIERQISQALTLLPKAYGAFVDWIGQRSLGQEFMMSFRQSGLSSALPTLQRLPGYALTVFGVAGELIVVIAGGIYLAAQPALYRKGLLGLVPAPQRPFFAALGEEIVTALRKWILAQLIAMAAVGFMVGVAMWAVDVPAPLALGLFAGIAEFVPIAGPVASAAVALLFALLHGPEKVAWTLLSFVVIQAIEGNLLIPLVHQKVVRIPPLVTLFALIVFGVIFGLLGIVMAMPLAVVALTVIQHLQNSAPRDVVKFGNGGAPPYGR